MKKEHPGNALQQMTLKQVRWMIRTSKKLKKTQDNNKNHKKTNCSLLQQLFKMPKVKQINLLQAKTMREKLPANYQQAGLATAAYVQLKHSTLKNANIQAN